MNFTTQLNFHQNIKYVVLEFPDCDTSEYRCANHQCIPKSGRCNGKMECRDGTDENDCGNKKFN